MAAGDRTAELKLKTTLEGGAKAAEETKAIRTETEKLGDTAAGVAGDLNREASALDDVSQATQKTAQESQEARGAIEGMGASGEAAGRDIAQGAGVAAASVEKIGEGAKEAAREIDASADIARQNVETVTAAFREQAEAIRRSDAPLTEQRAQLEAVESQARALSETMKGAPGLSAAVASSIAEVKAKIAEVDAELGKAKTGFDGLSTTAKAALGSIRGETITVDDALVAAAKQLRAVDDELRETGRIGPRAINNVTQAVENYRATIIASRGSIEAARTEEIATLRTLETELDRVTFAANRLTNASKDQRVALQETGYRIAGISMAAQDLGRLLGPTGEAVGNTAARLGILAMNAEQAKDAFHGLNIGTIGAAKGVAGVGAQLGAVLAVLAAAFASVKKLTEGTKDLGEGWELFAEKVPNLQQLLGTLKLALKDLGDWIASTSSEIFNLGEAFATMNPERIREEINAIAIAMQGGSTAVSAYHELLRSGVSIENASRMALIESKVAHVAATEALKHSTAAVGDNKKGHDAATPSVAAHTAAVNEYASAERQARDAVAQASLENVVLQRAVNGTTSAITLAVENIARSITASDENSVALGRLATALSTVLSQTDGLTSAQRAQIQAVIDLAKRADELTEAEQRKVLVLAEAITHGRTINDLLKQQTEATGELTEATNAQTEADIAASAATAERRAEIERELDAVRKQIDLLRERTGAVEEHGAASAAASTDIEFLQRRERDLQEELEGSITIWHASSEAAEGAAGARDQVVDSLQREATAQRDVGTSTQATNAVLENGRIVITNVTEAQRQAAAATREHADATGAAKDGHEDAAIAMQKLRDQVVPLPKDLAALAAVMPGVAANIREARDAAREYADEMERAAGATKRMNDEAARAASE